MPDITDEKDKMTFTHFTVLLGFLFSFTMGTNYLLWLTVMESEASKALFRSTIAFPWFVWFLQHCWLIFQLIVFLDILSSYLLLAWGRLCPRCLDWCTEKWQDCAPESWNQARAFIGNSDLRRPLLWRFIGRQLGIELSPRRYLLVLALLLPLNVLVFYRNIGNPVYTRSRLVDVSGAMALVEATWPTAGHAHAGGLSLDLLTWIITSEDANVTGSKPLANITSKECYHPDDPEFKLLTRLQEQEASKQAHCESVLGHMLVRRMGWDDDMWEELYSFTVRLFGAFAGVMTDHMFSHEGSGFLEDMTDIFDMYLMSFEDVSQLHEGRPLLGSKSDTSMSFHDCVPIFLVTAYSSIFLRALAMFGWTPISRFLIRMGHPAGKEGEAGLKRLQFSVGAATSLLCVEAPFLSLRAMALVKYQVPVSVLAVKNVLHAYNELRILRIVKGLSGENQRADEMKEMAARLCWRCRKRRPSEQDEEKSSRRRLTHEDVEEPGAGAAAGAGHSRSAAASPSAPAGGGRPPAASATRLAGDGPYSDLDSDDEVLSSTHL